MQIIQASLKDIPAIREIVDITWPVTYGEILSAEQMEYMISKFYSEKLLAEQMQHPGHTFMLAEEDGIVYGFAGIQFDYPEKGTTKLHKIYILPAAQGKNTGRKLIEHITSLAKAAGQSSLLLNVNRFNRARFFYEKIGFSVLKEEDVAIGEGYLMEDYVMILIFDF